MRAPRVVTLAAALGALVLATPSAARAEPDPGIGLVAGTAVMLLGFTVGSTVVVTANGSNTSTNTGWLIMESGFVLAPWTAHAALGQWTRGLAFAALPAAATGGTIGLFDYAPGTVLHGTLVQQRFLWGLFGGGLVSAVLGILDVTFAAPAQEHGPVPVAVAPMVGAGQVGLQVGGDL
ncbi:MAG TPA: hypothetical protein VK762_02335 [Polyangiaceae bacterium]|nr:hypothetical protein [Polyangiaceae bacterium]